MQLTSLARLPSLEKACWCLRKNGRVIPNPPRLPILRKSRRSTPSQLRATPLTRGSIVGTPIRRQNSTIVEEGVFSGRDSREGRSGGGPLFPQTECLRTIHINDSL